MDAKLIVSKLRALASDPENRETIVKDQGCLPGLILFLDHDDAEGIYLSIHLSIYRYMSMCRCSCVHD
jgi:armadillo repeat-containing protein 1